MSLTIPEHVLKHAPWSISKAGVIEKCSYQFDLKYVKKEKELVTFEQSRVGVAVHAALEMTLAGHKQKLAFQIAADNSELTTDEREKLDSFWEQVERFTKKMLLFKQKHGVTKTLIEQKWAIRPDFTGTEFFDKTGFFRGVVDFAMLTGKKDLVIIDHKSGKQNELSKYETQFRAYCVMAVAMMPEIRGVQTAINFVVTDQLEWNKYVTAETIRTEYRPWLVNNLVNSCEKLLKEPAAVKGWFCDWCGYKPICPLFKKGSVSGDQG